MTVETRAKVIRVSFGAKDPKGAQKLFEQADEIDLDPKAYEQAEELYRRALRLDPSHTSARTNLGNVRYRRGDVAEAVRHWQDSACIDPMQPEPYYNMGVVRLENGDLSGAILFFRNAIRILPRNESELEAAIHYNLASALDESGDVEAARIHWQKHLDLTPDSEWAERARAFLADTSRLTLIRGGKGP